MSFHLFATDLEDDDHVDFGVDSQKGEYQTIEDAFDAAKLFEFDFPDIYIAELVDGKFINKMDFFADGEYVDTGYFVQKGFRSVTKIVVLEARVIEYLVSFQECSAVIRNELISRGCTEISIWRNQNFVLVDFTYQGKSREYLDILVLPKGKMTPDIAKRVILERLASKFNRINNPNYTSFRGTGM